MFDSIVNTGEFLSDHWLAEVFSSKLRDLTRTWRDEVEHGKHTPWHGLQSASGPYLKAKAELPEPGNEGYEHALTGLHTLLLEAAGFTPKEEDLETFQGDTQVTVPLLARAQSDAGEALHVLQAQPIDDIDALFADDTELVRPITVDEPGEKPQSIACLKDAVGRLLLTDDKPRYLLVAAGAWVVLTDVARWADGRYLAFDVDTALSRKDTKATGELAWHAGLWSADVLLPGDDGTAGLDEFSDDSFKHAVGVSEDLRDGLRTSIELIANEVIRARRAAGMEVEELDELPRELTIQSLRFLYRILFLLYAEARPELGILPVGAPEYSAGYGLDRLRELIQVPLTESSAEGSHLHDSLRLLFRLVNDGFGHTSPANGADTRIDGPDDDAHLNDALVFEPLRADLFDPHNTPLIADVRLRNSVLQEVLQLLLLSKPSKGSKQRGYVSYAQLGINQLGAVYEGLMSYSGVIASTEMIELAKDGNPDKGSWLVPRERASDYAAKHIVHREDRITGESHMVVHEKGSFVFRLSGRERQRSASYYTPEVLTRCVVKHALAELLDDDKPAADILDLRICEPALGSGAFLNEAINQLTDEYLQRRQAELGEYIEPENMAAERQRVKAYLALHRSYGVDLNATAVELAEVSLWLNVMHPGLQAPWFGLHLRRGNSLIGARRATYDLAALSKAKKKWYKISPTERPLSEATVPDGEIHHFLLPADDWGAVGATKQAKELRPDKAQELREWARRMRAKPDKHQTKRLQGLAKRAERLWDLTRQRMEISEREIARHIDVWGADLEPVDNAVTRDQVESGLNDLDGPYQRLRLVMDAWCALWFWPVTTETAPPELDDWLTVLEALLGVQGEAGKAGTIGLHEQAEDFADLAQIDDMEKSYYFMRDVMAVVAGHPWLGVARDIAQREGFFHWELDFAQIFARGGFDLQVGNPPWVRPTWNDDVALAEHDPFFMLENKIPTEVFNDRRAALLESVSLQGDYLKDVESWCGLANSLGSEVEHAVLVGVQPNLYMNFMERAWRNVSIRGTIGLLHPESHFTDPKAGRLREATYQHLRRHWQFINELMLFEDIHDMTHYGIHVYGSKQEVKFLNSVGLYHPDTLDRSFEADSQAELPGHQYPWGGWDLRPHPSRIMTIDADVLAQWAELFDPSGTPAAHARMVRPLTTEHLDVLATLAQAESRMADAKYWWSSGWHEKGAKDGGYIRWTTDVRDRWAEVILQGPHFHVATPFAKQPNENCKNNLDYSDWDLEALPESVIPRTNYQRACDRDRYDAGLTDWNGQPYTDYWRVAWRRMTQPGSERSLIGAFMPPGPAHVDAVNTLALAELRETCVLAGLWSSLPLDYLIKVSGASKVNKELVDRLPAPLDHPAAPYLLLRTLRLNCLTRDYAPLWEELFEHGFTEDSWTEPFLDWPSLGNVTSEWTMATPLRTDFERRAALVEIDALAALMLGLSAEQLALMYRAQFAVLRKYEYEMFFDQRGRKIARSHHAAGVNQSKDDYNLVKAYVDGIELGEEADVELPEMYQPPFIRPDREAEMKAAYAEFERRLQES